MERRIFPELNFIKAICAIGIIVYHFSCHTLSVYKPLLAYPNGDWGHTLVTVFFIVSGFLLYNNYPKVERSKAFYYKRVKSIYVPFWIVFLFYYLQYVYENGQLFYLGRPWTLILSFFGVDGYLLYRIPNYYIVGEWFLGAIILLYLLYPLLSRLMERFMVALGIVLVACYLGVLATDMFMIDNFYNLFSCLISFYAGMVLAKVPTLLNHKLSLVASMAVFLVLIIWPIPISTNVTIHATGLALFIVLVRAGRVILQWPPLRKVSDFLGSISYEIFLFQHVIVNKVLGFMPTDTALSVAAAILVSVCLTIAYALIVSLIVKALFRSKPFLYLEERILKVSVKREDNT